MNYRLAISFVLLIISSHITLYAQQIPASEIKIAADTITLDSAKQDELIDEIVNTKKIPKKDKVEYFGQLTRYGFKNLFQNILTIPAYHIAAR